MPGPVSDAFDPEFSTAYNRGEVRNAIKYMYNLLGRNVICSPPLPILQVVFGDDGPKLLPREPLCEREWRLLRFACERALEVL